MNLGDVSDKTVPKMTMVSKALNGGAISTRTFIPHRCHDAIGVLGAVSVATACLLSEGPAAELAVLPDGQEKSLSIEHPTGEMTVVATLDADGSLLKAAILRTARKLFDGVVFGR
jgi:4-oxalomesaconate tautomerase